MYLKDIFINIIFQLITFINLKYLMISMDGFSKEALCNAEHVVNDSGCSSSDIFYSSLVIAMFIALILFIPTCRIIPEYHKPIDDKESIENEFERKALASRKAKVSCILVGLQVIVWFFVIFLNKL